MCCWNFFGCGCRRRRSCWDNYNNNYGGCGCGRGNYGGNYNNEYDNGYNYGGGHSQGSNCRDGYDSHKHHRSNCKCKRHSNY